MILTGDTETEGLSGDFTLGCIYRSQKEYSFHDTKHSFWKQLISYAQTESERGKTCTVYFYNAGFDFYKFYDWNIPGVTILNKSPFIAIYSEPHKKSTLRGHTTKGRAVLYIRDLWTLFNLPLAEAAQLIGMQKHDLPSHFREGTTDAISDTDRTYVLQDAKLVMKLYKRIKKELKTNHVNVKNLISTGQIAVNTFFTYIKKHHPNITLFEDRFSNKIIEPTMGTFIHNAYRYGRIELSRKPSDHAYEVDINSLYPYIASSMIFPDLSTERHIRAPYDFLGIPGQINLMKQYPCGVSMAIMQLPKKKPDYGILVVRTKESRYYPRNPGSYIVGTYTHPELLYAIEHGYQLIRLIDTVTYKPQDNPFTSFFQLCYANRQNDRFSNHFWKRLSNFLIGKFAQRRPNKVYKIDSIMKATWYTDHGWRIIQSYGTNYLYLKETEATPSKYYAPIIPALVNGLARIYHHKYLSKVPRNNFLYCDTDNIVFEDKSNMRHFPIGEGFGEFKVQAYNKAYYAYNKKSYKVGDDVHLSGIRKPRTPEEKRQLLANFDDGIAYKETMKSVNTTTPLQDVGTFTRSPVNLQQSVEGHLAAEYDLEQQHIYLDIQEDIDKKHLQEAINYV